MACSARPAADSKLVQIVDAALADVTRRSGAWLVFRPGCTSCCIGPFAINQLDAARLRQGLADLDTREAERAGRVRGRGRGPGAGVSPDFPSAARCGLLDERQKTE